MTSFTRAETRVHNISQRSQGRSWVTRPQNFAKFRRVVSEIYTYERTDKQTHHSTTQTSLLVFLSTCRIRDNRILRSRSASACW